jgi:SMODS and SLOG-associating 2TM effector domain 1/Protein of unknown function (DUF4231)
MASAVVSSALTSTWNRFRTWDSTAVQLRISLDRWRLWTLILAIAGAVLVTLGQQLGSLVASLGPWAGLPGKVASLAGTAGIALSAYFAHEALSNENVQSWTKCRSTAESLKATIYLYRAGVPPFDGTDRDAELVDRRAAIEDAVEGVELIAQAESEVVDLPPINPEDYIVERVNDQIEFYRKRSSEYQKKTSMLRQLVFWLGAAAVLLGVVSAVKPLVAAWTAVVATVIASLSSYVQSQRYQTLMAAYQSTARRLETLRDKWGASTKSDVLKNAFVQSCEEAMALENSAWVTQWSQRKPSDQKSSNSG